MSKPDIPLDAWDLAREFGEVTIVPGKRAFVRLNGYHTPIVKVYVDDDGDLILEAQVTR